MILLRIVAFPFAVLYGIITGFRNRLYDRGLKPVATFEVPVIGVGNLVMGGTGKTPLIEHLVRLLRPSYHVATLSRGYGRDTKGFRLAAPGDTARTLGDEPFQFYRKFGQDVTVAVGEERALAIPSILQEREETNVILLDDAFQHRRVKPALNVLLTDFHRPFYSDLIVPAGRLRESRRGARRADVIIVTKCPADLSDEHMMEVERAIRVYADRPVFFTRIHYGNPVSFGSGAAADVKDVVLVTGIANAKPLQDYLATAFRVHDHISFSDHHAYTRADVERFRKVVEKHPGHCLLTTEKDMVKLAAESFRDIVQHLPIFYVPIEVEFVKSGEDFDAIVLNTVRGA